MLRPREHLKEDVQNHKWGKHTTCHLSDDGSHEQSVNTHAEAAYAEGLEWQFGRNGRQKNEENAVACYRRAAEAILAAEPAQNAGFSPEIF